jgi:hypothetical protein
LQERGVARERSCKREELQERGVARERSCKREKGIAQ